MTSPPMVIGVDDLAPGRQDIPRASSKPQFRATGAHEGIPLRKLSILTLLALVLGAAVPFLVSSPAVAAADTFAIPVTVSVGTHELRSSGATKRADCCRPNDQSDLDGDGRGDPCDDDMDGDGHKNQPEVAKGSDPRDPRSTPKQK